jgi:hypothetical protein
MNNATQGTLGNLFIGTGGTLLAFITPEKTAIFAGLATGAWMCWQLAVAIYDRATRRRDEKRD